MARCGHERVCLDTGHDVACEDCGEIVGVVARFASSVVLGATEARELLRQGAREGSGVRAKLAGLVDRAAS